MDSGRAGPGESPASNTARSASWCGPRDADPVQSDFERANRIGARQQWHLSAANASRTGIIADIPGINHEFRVRVQWRHISDGFGKLFDDEHRITAWRRGIGRTQQSGQPDDERLLEFGEHNADSTRHHACGDDLDRRFAAVSEVI